MFKFIQQYQICLQIRKLQKHSKKATNDFNIRQTRLQKAHKGYAYELLELQMAVQDQKLSTQPSITQITRLIQLYMIGVEVLQSIADSRFVYFHNKIHSLMLKKHIVKKLHQAAGRPKQMTQKQTGIGSAINKAQLKDKKDSYQINFYFNQGQVDIKKVKQMLNFAENKKIQVQGKIKKDINKQEVRLEERIKQRKMRSQAGSIKGSIRKKDQQQIPSPPVRRKQTAKESRMQYFNFNGTDDKFFDQLGKNKANRNNSGSLQKIIFDRNYGKYPNNNGSNTQRKNIIKTAEKSFNQNDAI